MIEVQTEALQKLMSNCRDKYTSKEYKQMVNDSWEISENRGLYEQSKDGHARIHCLLIPTYAKGAIYTWLEKCDDSEDKWAVNRVLFHDIDSKLFDDHIWASAFRAFPNLQNRFQEIDKMSQIGWKPSSDEPTGPEYLDENAIHQMIKDAYPIYADRPYHPSAFGFESDIWVKAITNQILVAYGNARNGGRVVEAYPDLFVCHVGLTNVNREVMYLIIGMQDTPYILSTMRRIQIDFPDLKGPLLEAIYRNNSSVRREYPLLSSWGASRAEQYRALRKDLLGETWCFINEESTEENELKAIQNYIENTFARLLWQNKVLLVDIHKRVAHDLTNAKLAVFHTGLINKSYQSLYAVYRRNPQSNDKNQIWQLDCFEVAGHGVLSDIMHLPERADYFESIQDMFYDLTVSNARNPEINTEHILIDNLERLPEIAKKAFLGNDYEAYMSADQKRRKEIRENRPSTAKNNLTTFFLSAVAKAIISAECNYRTGVPMYYIREGKMTILLPIALAHEFEMQGNWEAENDRVECDFALAMQLLTITDQQTGEKTQKYTAKTVFNLDTAYRDARLVGRTGSDWLTPNLIKSTGTESVDGDAEV